MRINVIDPRFLADQHLVAEYRELKMLPKSLIRSIQSKKGLDLNKVSKHYTLNTGHGYFFYNKITFIEERFKALIEEMEYRKFQANFRELPVLDLIPEYLFNNYIPTDDAKLTNLERIRLRIDDKHTWFKYFGHPMSRIDWDNLYKKYHEQENLEFEAIDELKINPGPDNMRLKKYSGGHYS